MHFEEHIDIEAPPGRVWAVITDIARWPEWTPTVDTLQVLDPGPFRLGQRARLKQPGYPAAVWTVRSIEEGRAFMWDSGSLGMLTAANHVIEATPTGSHVVLSIDVGGPTAWLLGWIAARATRQFVPQETVALKRECERAAS